MQEINIPFDQIIKFGQRTMLDQKIFNVSWILGRFCNYSCSYCWPYARSDKVDHLDIEIYKSSIDSIIKQANNNGFEKFHWSFSGGEPTAYKHLPELITYLNSQNLSYQSLHLTTNLSPGSKWWTGWCNNTINFQRRSITASYHDEFAKEQEFSDKCLQLMNDGVFVTVNQVMVVEKFMELYERCLRLSEKGINVTLKPQSDPTASFIVDGYTEEMITLMRTGFPQKVQGEDLFQISLYDNFKNEYLFDQAERFNAFGFNKFKDWNCNAGYQSIIIRGDEVKRGYSCKEEKIGTLSDGFRLFDAPKKCVTETCISSADSKIPKCK